MPGPSASIGRLVSQVRQGLPGTGPRTAHERRRAGRGSARSAMERAAHPAAASGSQSSSEHPAPTQHPTVAGRERFETSHRRMRADQPQQVGWLDIEQEFRDLVVARLPSTIDSRELGLQHHQDVADHLVIDEAPEGRELPLDLPRMRMTAGAAPRETVCHNTVATVRRHIVLGDSIPHGISDSNLAMTSIRPTSFRRHTRTPGRARCQIRCGAALSGHQATRTRSPRSDPDSFPNHHQAPQIGVAAQAGVASPRIAREGRTRESASSPPQRGFIDPRASPRRSTGHERRLVILVSRHDLAIGRDSSDCRYRRMRDLVIRRRNQEAVARRTDRLFARSDRTTDANFKTVHLHRPRRRLSRPRHRRIESERV